MANNSHRFETLLKISHELNYTDDLDSVLERILAEARSLTESEAGTIYLRDGDELVFEHTQNELLFTSNLDNKNNYQSHRIPVTDSSIAGFVALNSLKGEGQDTVLTAWLQCCMMWARWGYQILSLKNPDPLQMKKEN